jgi:hypothetical protein
MNVFNSAVQVSGADRYGPVSKQRIVESRSCLNSVLTTCTSLKDMYQSAVEVAELRRRMVEEELERESNAAAALLVKQEEEMEQESSKSKKAVRFIIHADCMRALMSWAGYRAGPG